MTDLIDDKSLEIAVKTRVGEFTVQPVRMGKFKTFAQAAMPCANDVMAFLDAPKSDDTVGIKQPDGIDLVTLIDRHEENMFLMVSICSGLTKDHYDQLLPDDYLAIVGAVIEINADFFVQNLLPAVAGRIQSITERVRNIASKTAGMTQSSPSEPVATA